MNKKLVINIFIALMLFLVVVNLFSMYLLYSHFILSMTIVYVLIIALLFLYKKKLTE